GYRRSSRGSSDRSEQLTHAGARLVELRLARPHAALENRRTLFVRQPLDVVENEDRAVAGGERTQRGFDPRGEARIALGDRRRGKLAEPVVADFLTPAAARQVRERGVHRQPVDPGR